MNWIRTTLVLAIASLFAYTWGVVLREQLRAREPASPVRDAGALLEPGQQERSVAMGIYAGTLRIGSSFTKIERDGEGNLIIGSRTQVELRQVAGVLAQGPGELDVSFTAHVSPLSGLRSFHAESTALGMRLVGAVQNGVLQVRGVAGKERIDTSVPYREGAMLSSPLSPFGGFAAPSTDRLGQTWGMQVVNPFTGSLESVTVTMTDYRDFDVEGRERRYFRLAFRSQDLRWHVWLDEEGRPVVQELPMPVPLGIALVHEEAPAAVTNRLLELMAGPPAEPAAGPRSP
jgi:hypothetical protein